MRVTTLLFALLLTTCGGSDPREAPCTASGEPGYSEARDPGSSSIELATEIALRYIEEHPVEGAELRWDWTEAVLMHGLVELHRVTNDRRLLDYYRERIDAHLEREWSIGWSDHCPMALPALDLYARTGSGAYGEVIDAVVDYVFAEAPRNERGAITHLGNVIPAIESVWIDSLFMFGVPMTRWAECVGNDDPLDLLRDQVLIFSELLEDEPGLFAHAYDWPGDQTPGVFWARGNGWVIASVAEYLRMRARRGEADSDLEQLLDRQVEALSSLQDATTGLWWTVLNRPGETYLETSASALFGFAMARAWRYGWLDDDVLDVVFSALEGVRSRVARDEDGRPYVTGISGPTDVGTFEGYATVDLIADETYGVGATLLLLVETSGLESPCDGSCLEPPEHPRLLATPEMREGLCDRADQEPHTTLLERLRERANEDLERETQEELWDPRIWSANGHRALANAFLAWACDEPGAAERAREMLLALEPRFDDRPGSTDDFIHMTGVSISYTDAWDVLMGVPGALSDAEGAAIAETLTAINQDLYETFVLDTVNNRASCYLNQNNQCLILASCLGYVALAFPEEPRAKAWLDFATSEMDYLYGPGGHYLLEGGGVSEGPFYYQFGLAPSLAFLTRFERLYPDGRVQERHCVMRTEADPWHDHDCASGQPFTFEAPLDDPLFLAAADWAVALRLPNGLMPPIEDSGSRALNGLALLTRYGGDPHLLWSWYETLPDPMNTTRSAELTETYFTLLEPGAEPMEPPWRNAFLPNVGHAVLRSDHGPAARWLLLVAEEGDARKTVHDHADSLSFSMAAYGDYLLIDSGYYKPGASDFNAETYVAGSHNLILVDGEALERGQFPGTWLENDAYLRNTLDGEAVAWAEAHQSYRQTDFERGVALVRGRYYVVADHLETDLTDEREFRWRAHLGADYDRELFNDLGGIYEMTGDTLRVEGTTGAVVVHLAATEGPVVFEEASHNGYRSCGDEQCPRSPHAHSFVRGSSVGEHGVADGVVTGRAPDFLAVLAPYALDAGLGDDDAELQVTEVDVGEGSVAWLVETAEGIDLVWLREPDAATEITLGDGTVVETDARVAIVALDGSFALLTRGSTVVVDDEPLLEGEVVNVTSTEVR